MHVLDHEGKTHYICPACGGLELSADEWRELIGYARSMDMLHVDSEGYERLVAGVAAYDRWLAQKEDEPVWPEDLDAGTAGLGLGDPDDA